MVARLRQAVPSMQVRCCTMARSTPTTACTHTVPSYVYVHILNLHILCNALGLVWKCMQHGMACIWLHVASHKRHSTHTAVVHS